jgi:hypothetical protein
MNFEHLDEELVERYAMGRAGEGEQAEVEEHLLACESCRTRLADTEDFLRTLRLAVSEAEVRQPAKVIPIFAKRRALWTSLALAASLAIGIFSVRALRAPAGPPAVVMLQALRASGGENAAPADRPLTLVFPAANGRYWLEVVDASGAEEASTGAEARDGRISAEIKRLRPGSYWVRVYTPAEPRELLSEYPLRVR